MNSMMTTFFLLLLQRYEGTAKLPRNEDFYWKHEFSAILSYIQANYSRVKIRELAERFHYSERQITRIVQNCTGETFESLVTRLRMERSALLLRNTDTPIAKISQDVGYATISSFYRIFSATYACIPPQSIGPSARRHKKSLDTYLKGQMRKFAVLPLQNGDNVKTVQGNLGHATAAFTLDVYGHVSEKMKEDSAARMQAYIDALA